MGLGISSFEWRFAVLIPLRIALIQFCIVAVSYQRDLEFSFV